MSKTSLNIKMTNYNFVKEVATFAFVRSSGQQANITIHRETFIKLMNGDYSHDNLPEKENELQRSFKDTVIKEIKKDYDKWFDEEANTVTRSFLEGK